MPDITLCNNGKDCKYRFTCYRFKAKPNAYWQSYSDFFNSDIPEDEWACDYYIPVKEGEIDAN